MALVLKDRVKETSTTAGTGTLTLAGAVTGFQSFAAVGNGNTTYYAIADSLTGDWEVGIGTYTSSGTTLSRTTVLSSSNGGALVSFAANPKDVFVTYPSEKSVYEDAAGVVVQQSFGAITATSAALTTGTITTTPASNTDIVNKQYVDTLAASGIHFHQPVMVYFYIPGRPRFGLYPNQPNSKRHLCCHSCRYSFYKLGTDTRQRC